MKIIYLIRHSAPFVNLYNYDNEPWSEINKNMILSAEGENNAKKLCEIEELNNIDVVYSSNSFRAIATSKYIAEVNNLEIIIDNRINERDFGIKYLSELPSDFTKKQFDDKNLKLEDGESLNEVDKRFSGFISEILKNDFNNIALFIHGIVLMSYLATIAKVEFDGKVFKVTFKNKVVSNSMLSNPDVFKLVFNDNAECINIEHIIIK